MKKNGEQTIEALPVNDARIGWREIMNAKLIAEACDRWLAKRVPTKKRPRRWGNF